MRIRDKYYGAIIYATPGSGKTCLAKAHRDVLDGDSIYVQAMRNVVPSFRPLDDVDDRVNIYRFYKYVKFDPIIKRRALKEFKYLLTKKSKDDRFIILIGTVQLMHLAHYVYIQEDPYIVREGFDQEREYEEIERLGLNYSCGLRYMNNYIKK